ncbi:MAG: hypothetical protein DSY66_00790 [Persephonella sp.]|nr:MAG: hypothetical protein DSY66_00790 [Persephonella sp.]
MYFILEEYLKNICHQNKFQTIQPYTIVLKSFQQKKIEKIIRQTAKQIIKKLGNKEIYTAIADGTGFGYDEAYYLNNTKL